MHLPGLIEIPLRLILLVVGLLLPGSMVIRALRLPWSLASAFVTSAAALYVVVLVFGCTGAPISGGTLAGVLGCVTLVAWLIPTRNNTSTHPSSSAFFSQIGGWWPLYLVFWIIVGYRLAFQPLSGPDVSFRWSYLAEQMLKFGTLDFYPPRTGPDFVRYLWAESIPPGIASLYAWAYACGGSKNALWTSPVVALQLISAHEIIWRLANRWGGEVVARRAVLLAAACPLLTWSFLIGQETGLTAISVAGLVWCLQNSSEKGGRGWIVMSAIFAITAAGTREYGPIFAIVALVATSFMRLPWRHTMLFAAIALPVVLAWPTRVWILTGNPFYSLNVAGLFPINPVFAAWSEVFHQDSIRTFSDAKDWYALSRYLLLWALPATIGSMALIFLLARRLREARIVAVFVALAIALWFTSVFYTAGGLFYSLRVLSPAFVLLMVAGSYALGFLHFKFASRLISVAMALLLIEALPKTLVLPGNPYRITLGEWAHSGDPFGPSLRLSAQELTARIKALRLNDNKRILTDNGGLPGALNSTDIEVLPPWSPEVAFLFDLEIAPKEIARRWRAANLSYVVIGKASPTGNFITQHARWHSPYFTVITVFETESLLILQAAVNN